MILDDIPSPSAVICDADFSLEDDDAHDEASIDYETHKTTPPSVVSVFTRVTSSYNAFAESPHVGTLVEMLQQQPGCTSEAYGWPENTGENNKQHSSNLSLLCKTRSMIFPAKTAPAALAVSGKRNEL